MFKTILVPLDGSALAEQALAPASRIAERFGGGLLLLRVVGPERTLAGLGYLAPLPGLNAADAMRAPMDEAESYLAGLALPVRNLPIRRQVVAGAAPEMIVATAVQGGADLIAMSTHGRNGLLRLLYGSVAEAVLRAATVPVLLVPSRVAARAVDDMLAEAIKRPETPAYADR